MIKPTKGTVLLISCLHFGCATMFTSTRHTIHVDSDPKGAEVRSNKLSHEETTPTFINMKKGGDVYLDISKEGYQTNSLRLDKTMAPATFANLFLGGLSPIGLFIDWQSGAMWDYQDRAYVKLEKARESDTTALTDTGENAHRPFNSMGAKLANRRVQETNLSGPRLGFTYLSREFIQEIKREEGVEVDSVITQFGWQFEKGISIHEDGPLFVLELIPLLGGIDQDITTPTVFSFIGIRSKSGSEFALGPTWYDTTNAVGYAGGVTLKYHHIHIPLNLVVVPSKTGLTISLLTGFNW